MKRILQIELSEQDKLKIVKRLELLGTKTQRIVLLKEIPDDLKEGEEVSRFLLLVAALDQQVEWTVAWAVAKNLYKKFGRVLLRRY